MEKIINSFAEYIALELKLDKDNKEVIAYGIFALLQTLISILLVMIFGIIFKCIVESLIIFLTVSILRKYSGGVHASSPERCIILGTIICIGETLIVKKIIYPIINIKLLIVISAIVFIFSYVTVIKLAPLDSPKKQIKNDTKKKKMKRSSIIILTIYLIIVVFINISGIYHNLDYLFIYAICIEIGSLWQTFTLTSKGYLLVSRLDNILKRLV
jgi:accessory gene regulator B